MAVDPEAFQRLRDARRHRLAAKHKATNLACWLQQSRSTCLRAGFLCFKHTNPKPRQQAATFVDPNGQVRRYTPFVGGSSRLTPDPGSGLYLQDAVQANRREAEEIIQMDDLYIRHMCLMNGIPLVTEEGTEVSPVILRQALLAMMTNGFGEALHADLSKLLRKIYPWFNVEENLRKKLWRGSGRALCYSYKANRAQTSELRKANNANAGSRLFAVEVKTYWDNAWKDVSSFFTSQRLFNNPQHADRIEKVLLGMLAAGEGLTDGTRVESLWWPKDGPKRHDHIPLGFLARRWLRDVRKVDPNILKDMRPPRHVDGPIQPETLEDKFNRLLAVAENKPDLLTEEDWEHLERLATIAGA